MSANNNRKDSFGRRFWRALIGLLAILTFGAILAATGSALYFGFIEFQRISARLDSNNSTVSLIRSDVNTLMEDSSTQAEVERLQTTIDDLEAQIDLLQTDVSSDIDRQADVLTTLSDTVANNDSQFSTLETNINTLSDALAAIQGDIIDNGSRIDALGGEIDTVETAVTDLGTEMIAMEEEAVAMIEEMGSHDSLQETLALFRVWELITRARLRILENNIGLAMADIETAVQTIDGLLLLETLETDAEKLEMVQARLALSLVNLPERPTLASVDLESAWDELDLIFTEDILTNVAIVVEETAVEELQDTTPTPTGSATEIDATATPSITPTLTLTPTVTATPTPTP